MKLETFEREKKPSRRKRGPRPKPLMSEFEAAYVRLCMARKSFDFWDVAEALGCRDGNAKNVMRRAKGF